jgi:hypothetical protein
MSPGSGVSGSYGGGGAPGGGPMLPPGGGGVHMLGHQQASNQDAQVLAHLLRQLSFQQATESLAKFSLDQVSIVVRVWPSSLQVSLVDIVLLRIRQLSSQQASESLAKFSLDQISSGEIVWQCLDQCFIFFISLVHSFLWI